MLSALRRLRAGKQSGWLAMAPLGTRVHVVQLVTSAGRKPALQWACEADWRDPAATLRSLRRSHALSANRVAVLQPSQYQLLTLDAPELPREEWRDAVRWRLKEMVDFAVDDAGVDVLDIPADPHQRRRASIMAVAASRAVLAPLADAAHAAHLAWQAVDIAETALRNIAALMAEVGRGEALLHVGSTHSTLVVTAQGELLLSRNFEVTFAQLVDADVSMRQQHYERASLELQRTLDNVERQFGYANLNRVQVVPGAPLQAFIDYVRDLVYVPVVAFDLATALDLAAVPELLDPTLQAAYLTAIGAALR